MNRKELKRKVYNNILTQIKNQTKDASKEELQIMLAQAVFQSNGQKEVNALLRNAQYGTSSELYQQKLFDPLKPGDNWLSESFLAEQEKLFDQKHLDDLQLTKEVLENKEKAISKQKKHIDSLIEEASRVSSGKDLAYVDKQNNVYPAKPQKIDVVEEYPADYTCPICGAKCTHVSWHKHTIIEYVPGTLVFKKLKRETVSCPNKCIDENDKTIIYDGDYPEPFLIPNSPATESLVAEIIHERVDLALPYYRIQKEFSYNGFNLSRQTQWNMVKYVDEHYLQPVVAVMKEQFKTMEFVHLDESRDECLQVKEREQSTMLVGVTAEYLKTQMAIYTFSEDKKYADPSTSFVTKMIGNNFTGDIMTDGAGGYENYSLATKHNCMAHARRNFHEALVSRDDFKEYRRYEKKNDLKKCAELIQTNTTLKDLLTVMLGFSHLYDIERKYKGQPYEVITAARQALSKPVFDTMTDLIRKIQEGFPGGNAAYKAANYFLSRLPELSLYLEDGRYPIDNNRCERMVKPFTIARRNYLFHFSIKGAEVTADCLTLTMSAILNNLNPYKYLTYILKEMRLHGTTPDVIQRLLPYSSELPKELRMN